MAKRQKLIHLHSSGVANVLNAVDLAKGEIAVRHATEKPELYIRKEDDSLATFIDEKAIDNKIDIVKNQFEGEIDGVSTALAGYATTGALETQKTLINNLSASTIAEVSRLEGEIGSASAAAVTSAVATATAYTDTEVGKVNAAFAGYATTGALETQKTRISNLSAGTIAEVSRLEGEIGSASAAAVTSAVATATAYTNTEIGKVNTALAGYAKNIKISNLSGVSNTYAVANNTVEIDFEELVIDCGTF